MSLAWRKDVAIHPTLGEPVVSSVHLSRDRAAPIAQETWVLGLCAAPSP